MSHLKERKEKICLNCNANLYGRFCHVCGQENLEPKETVWHLVTHFFNDITHFDGKLFSTVKLLITKPGFLSTEYMIGRRASYLNPIRMYVFISAFFFLVLFSITSADKIMNINENNEKGSLQKTKTHGIKDWEKEKATLQYRFKKETDSSDKHHLKEEITGLDERINAAKKLFGDTSTRTFDEKQATLMIFQANMDSLKKAGMPAPVAKAISTAASKDLSKKNNDADFLDMITDQYYSLAAYDSIQKKLPDDKKDGWFKKVVYREIIRINDQVKKDKNGFFEHFRENFLHSFPKILFFSLPFFALILKFVYIRRKNFYYTDHGIFAINVYCATFILLLVLIILNQLETTFPWQWLKVILDILIFATWLYMFIYLYKAMRRFYKQGRVKTFLKYMLVGFLAFMVDIFLLLLFLVISAVTV